MQNTMNGSRSLVMEVNMARTDRDLELQIPSGDQETETIFHKANCPVTLKFEDVVYKIKAHGGLLNRKTKSEDIEILNSLSGIVHPGEMLALLGPSGSGKTTLLTALSGRLGGHLEGIITYNGKAFSSTMKRKTGFVTQDDVLYPHLTVTETLVYTALLRLPKTLSKLQKRQHAEAVISQLGLTRCKDSIIGGQFLRGISGGERKRVSIGQEMLINPSLLFLDEPTSGLDSTTALRIVSTLLELVNGGRTIVMTIHQPSSRLFYMFHKVLLLCEGNPLYFGKGPSLLEYFASIGFSPSVAMNPADYLLDLANGVSTADFQEDQAAIKQTLMAAYKQNLSPYVKSEIAIDQNHVHGLTDDKLEFKGWLNNWWNQFTVLLARGIKERRHQVFSKLRIAQILFISILAGFLWWNSDANNLQDQVGLLFFYSSFWGFFPVFQAIYTFPQERTMLEKERASGMYRLSSYFMALTLGNLPMELVLPTVSFIITYWMAGLKPTPECFLSGLFSLLYGVLCSQGLGLAIGALAMDGRSAIVLGSVIVMSFQLTTGFYVQHVPCFMVWIKYVSIAHHTFKLMLGSQFKHGETYACRADRTCLVEDAPEMKAVGLDGQVISVIALAVMIVGYRLIAYVALMRIGVNRQ